MTRTSDVIALSTSGWFTLALLFTLVAIGTNITWFLTQFTLVTWCARATTIEPDHKKDELKINQKSLVHCKLSEISFHFLSFPKMIRNFATHFFL